MFHVGTLGGTDQLWAAKQRSGIGWQPFRVEVAEDAATAVDATFTSAGGVKFVAFKLEYDPELVSLADVEPGADLPDTARISFRTAATEDGAEAYITVSSDEPIPAGTVNLASISVNPRSAGRYVEGLRKLHVQHVNGDLVGEPESVRISIADLAPSPAEDISRDSGLVDRPDRGDEVVRKIRLKIAQFEESEDLASTGAVDAGAASEEDQVSDLQPVLKIAIPYASSNDPSPSPSSLERSHRWKFNRSMEGSASELPHNVRIPLVSVAKDAFVAGSARM